MYTINTTIALIGFIHSEKSFERTNKNCLMSCFMKLQLLHVREIQKLQSVM